VTRLLLYINRRSGVAHVDRCCDAIASVPARYLRLELYNADRPRRMCSRCWNGSRPRRSDLAGPEVAVTERSEGNPRSGLTDADGSATSATERAADVEEAFEVGSSNTRPGARYGTPDDPGWDDADDLIYPRGYVLNRWTGEVLSSVLADIQRERGR
jgi:hypothetical protein